MTAPDPKTGADPLYAAAERSPLVDAIVLRGLYVISWITYAIPWRAWVALTYLLALGTMVWSSHRRRVALTNIRHIRRGRMPAWPLAWSIGAGQIATHFRTIVGTLRAGARAPREADRLVIEHLDRLAPYLGRRGIVIVAPHTGPYPMLGLLARHWLKSTGFQGEFAVVARLFRPFRSGALMEWFIERFGRAGITIIPVHESPTVLANKLKRILDERGLVALLLDEPTPTPSLAVPFFDDEIKLPIGPARLARATGSVVIPVVATYAPGQKMRVTIGEPIEPTRHPAETLERIARTFEEMIERHPEQWAMLTPVWSKPAPEPSAGLSLADLHLHTPGSDGLVALAEWVGAMDGAGVRVVAIADHDHIETVREWHAAGGGDRARVIPGVELTARGRIVHLGVLFPGAVPRRLPKPDTPLAELVRWARSIPGSVVILVHPIPLLWRGQLRALARAGLLPDAIESRFPFVGWRSGAIERAARRYGLAIVGGSDAHMAPGQLGGHATVFPGETAADLLAAIKLRTTSAVTRPVAVKVPRAAYAWQSLYSWLLPFRNLPLVPRLRAALFARARAAARRGADAGPRIPEPAASDRERRAS